jgi:hypothetical protein
MCTISCPTMPAGIARSFLPDDYRHLNRVVAAERSSYAHPSKKGHFTIGLFRPFEKQWWSVKRPIGTRTKQHSRDLIPSNMTDEDRTPFGILYYSSQSKHFLCF